MNKSQPRCSKQKEGKGGCWVESGWGGVVGPVEYWLVILPPKRAGGERCSVKPASRGALLALGTMPPNPSIGSQGSTPLLERASQLSNPSAAPYLSSHSNLRPPWCPHMGHKSALLDPAILVTKPKPI